MFPRSKGHFPLFFYEYIDFFVYFSVIFGLFLNFEIFL